MASSEPLIQEVARFQFGGNINLLPLTVQTGKEPLANNPQVGNYKDALLRFFAEKVRPKGGPGMLKTGDNTATLAGSGNDGTTSAIDSRYASEFLGPDIRKMGKEIQETGGFGSVVTDTPGVGSKGELTSGALGERKVGLPPDVVTGQGLEGMDDIFASQALKAQEERKAMEKATEELRGSEGTEKKRAIEGGMPDPSQEVDAKALQDQLSGGRISSEAPQTLGVTADQGAYAKDKDSTEKFRNGNKSLGDIKKDVQNTVRSGVGAGGSMQQLVDEFTGSVEKHKGLDRGLAIAKIGFAMAAGESPNAITNIAKALSDGADMFIKDQAERDAWNRQVNLAAVQYAATEITKQRAEGRAIARDRLKSKTMTFGPKGGVYRGKEYGAYEDVEVLQGDIQDNNVPTGIVSTSTITALGAKSKGYTALMKDLVKQKVIGEAQGAKDQEDYANFASTAIKAERGQAVVNNVLLAINDPDGPGITGLVPAAQTAYQKLRSAANLPTNITSLDQARTHMRQLLQDIVPVTLAAYQGANSISNRDIDLLITAYFGDNALESGGFQFVFQTDAALTQRLQGAAIAMKESQSAAFSGMRSIENRVSSLYKRGSVTLDPNTGNIIGDPASGLFAASRERLDKAGLGFPDLPQIGSNIPYFRDKDGRIQLGKAKG